MKNVFLAQNQTAPEFSIPEVMFYETQMLNMETKPSDI